MYTNIYVSFVVHLGFIIGMINITSISGMKQFFFQMIDQMKTEMNNYLTSILDVESVAANHIKHSIELGSSEPA